MACVGGGILGAERLFSSVFRYVVFRMDGIKEVLLGDALHFVLVDKYLMKFFTRPNAGDMNRVIGTLGTVLVAYGFGEFTNRAGRGFADENFAAGRMLHCV